MHTLSLQEHAGSTKVTDGGNVFYLLPKVAQTASEVLSHLYGKLPTEQRAPCPTLLLLHCTLPHQR